MASSARGRLGSIPADHDVLGHPNLRDQQGGPNGQTRFQQISPTTRATDVTKMKAKHLSGDLKYTPTTGQ